MGFFSAVKKIFSGKEKREDEEIEIDVETLEDGEQKANLEDSNFLLGGVQEFNDTVNQSSFNALTEIEIAEDTVKTQEVILEGKKSLDKKEREAGAHVLLPKDADFQTVTVALRKCEPKLSVWLSVLLEKIEDIDEYDGLFWKRLAYFFKALETPEEEATAFIEEFRAWLLRVDYFYLNDFRSELQYRLALALDLEDEEDERDRLFLKVQVGLERTRNQLGKGLQSLFSGQGKLGEAFFEDLEELFIMSDMGADLSLKLVAKLREHATSNKIEEAKDLLPYLQEEVSQIFRTPKVISAVNPPEVVLMIGVNGVGKTTTIAKLAYRAKMQGKKVLIAGADTFRAAAVEQLETWAIRIGADFYSKGSGADPAAVAYEAMDKAVAGAYDVVFIDTAGRLHNKSNLMDELQKIRNVIGKKHAGAPHRSVLVIDATTGQNAMQQTKVFKESAGVDEIILTKLDGTAKGGVALSVASTFEVPITYIGLGEKMEDLRPFHAEDFAKALFGEFSEK